MLTQLRILSKLFDCRWLTCWPYNKGAGRMDLVTMMRNLYGTTINKEFKYCDWAHGHPQRKAGAILAEGMPTDFYWLEDPLDWNEYEALKAVGLADRYVRVEPQGMWGFADACCELFRRVGITASDIKKVGGKLEWFTAEYIEAQHTPPIRRTLEHVQFLIRVSSDDHQAVADIRKYLEKELDTLYKVEG